MPTSAKQGKQAIIGLPVKTSSELSQINLFRDQYAETCERIHRTLLGLPEWKNHKEVPFLNGLYFWFQAGERCSHFDSPRIVRVGNHPNAEDGLKTRLRNHYSGQKNGSVFRKFIGGALLRSRDPDHPCLRPGPGLGHWEKQDEECCPTCRDLEFEVTQILREDFFIKCVKIDDREFRNYLERVIIRDLSHCPTCKPSQNWLGRFAYNPKIRELGMWNSEFALGPLAALDDYLRRFEDLVTQTKAFIRESAARPK
jgi:hypothetical protein